MILQFQVFYTYLKLWYIPPSFQPSNLFVKPHCKIEWIILGLFYEIFFHAFAIDLVVSTLLSDAVSSPSAEQSRFLPRCFSHCFFKMFWNGELANTYSGWTALASWGHVKRNHFLLLEKVFYKSNQVNFMIYVQQLINVLSKDSAVGRFVNNPISSSSTLLWLLHRTIDVVVKKIDPYFCIFPFFLIGSLLLTTKDYCRSDMLHTVTK